MIRALRFRALLPAAALVATALAGCQTTGLSGREAELARQRALGFEVTEATAERAVFMARGQRIMVEPPAGYCLDEESVVVSRNAAFSLVADCLGTQHAAPAEGSAGGQAAGTPPERIFPGILTVSVSGEPAYGPEPGALDDFEALLDTGEGQKLLGRGASPAPSRVVATRRVGGALYVLVDESAGMGTDDLILTRYFWRAFIGINDRLVLVTVSSFTGRPLAVDAMMGFLAQQVAQLRRANGLPADAEEDEIASHTSEKLDSKNVPGLVWAPIPRAKVASAGAGAAAGTGRSAPRTAPHPSQRPG